MPVGKVEVHAPRPSLTVYIAEYMNYLVTKISCGYNKLSKTKYVSVVKCAKYMKTLTQIVVR